MKTEIRTQIQEVPVYIADGGTEFNTEAECWEYEVQNKRKTQIEKAEKLRITELDDVIPLINEDTSVAYVYRWYKLTNKKDFKIVDEAYNCGWDFAEPLKYPSIMCVESYSEGYYGDAYNYLLSDCKQAAEKFWKQMGYKVTIEKED